MNEIEEIWAEDIAAGCAYMDADHTVHEARKALDDDIATVAYTTTAANAVVADIQRHQHDLDVAVKDREVALTRMLSAARALDYKEKN